MAAKQSTEATSRLRSCLFVLPALWQQGPEVAIQVLDLARRHLWVEDEPPGLFPVLRR